MKNTMLYGLTISMMVSTQLSWAAPPRYIITDLGSTHLQLSSADHIGSAINNKGQVLGELPVSFAPGEEGEDIFTYHSFLYSKGRLKDLGTYNDQSLRLNLINNKGEMAGSYGDSYPGNPILYKNGDFIDLSSVVGDVKNKITAINDKGQVTIDLYGASMFSDASSGLIIDSNNNTTKIPFSPSDINNRGYVVGTKNTENFDRPGAYRYCLRTQKLINILGRNNYGEANSINDAGLVVGARYIQTGDLSFKKQAYVYDGKKAVNLGSFREWPDKESVAKKINNKGQIIGYANTDMISEDGPPSIRAFLYDAQNGMLNLNDLIMNKAGWDVMPFAADINDKGEIVGTAYKTSGWTGAVLLTPVGPASIVNDAVTFQPLKESFRYADKLSNRCATQGTAEVEFKARLTNTSNRNLTALELKLKKLKNVAFIKYFDTSFGRGDRFGVSTLNAGSYRDGKLSPRESIKASFTACLKKKEPFAVSVNVLAAKTK